MTAVMACVFVWVPVLHTDRQTHTHRVVWQLINDYINWSQQIFVVAISYCCSVFFVCVFSNNQGELIVMPSIKIPFDGNLNFRIGKKDIFYKNWNAIEDCLILIAYFSVYYDYDLLIWKTKRSNFDSKMAFFPLTIWYKKDRKNFYEHSVDTFWTHINNCKQSEIVWCMTIFSGAVSRGML